MNKDEPEASDILDDDEDEPAILSGSTFGEWASDVWFDDLLSAERELSREEAYALMVWVVFDSLKRDIGSDFRLAAGVPSDEMFEVVVDDWEKVSVGRTGADVSDCAFFAFGPFIDGARSLCLRCRPGDEAHVFEHTAAWGEDGCVHFVSSQGRFVWTAVSRAWHGDFRLSDDVLRYVLDGLDTEERSRAFEPDGSYSLDWIRSLLDGERSGPLSMDDVRMAIGQVPGLPLPILETLSKDGDPEVRLSAVKSGRLPMRALARMTQDRGKHVRKAVAERIGSMTSHERLDCELAVASLIEEGVLERDWTEPPPPPRLFKP